MSFANDVLSMNVSENEIGAFWLGQAGFILKTSENKLIAIDLYLSDYCERLVGFKRLMAKILQPNELRFDAILISHSHPDHFDCDSIPFMIQKGAEMFCTEDCIPECERLNIKDNYTIIKQGDCFNVCGLNVHAVSCDHGSESPFAVGFVIEFNGKKIYFMGDTAFRGDYFNEEIKQSPDLLLPPINGAFGNLSEKEASIMAKGLNAKLTVPCHFWNFGEHGGNPYEFVKNMQASSMDNRYYLMQMGEGIII